MTHMVKLTMPWSAVETRGPLLKSRNPCLTEPAAMEVEADEAPPTTAAPEVEEEKEQGAPSKPKKRASPTGNPRSHARDRPIRRP
jgi:hypothetical protein